MCNGQVPILMKRVKRVQHTQRVSVKWHEMGFNNQHPTSTHRVAKCQFFTQIISVQLNLPQEKARKLREVFDILSIKWA